MRPTNMNLSNKLGSNSARSTLPPGDLSKDSINKYKKKKSSNPSLVKNYSKSGKSQNQFQKYFLDATNVFFEDRDTLKSLQQKRTILKIGLPIFFFLAVTYFAISAIKPYKGICPSNATCKVFLRCNPGYELTEQGHECRIQKSIIEKVETVCEFQVEKLKREYGDIDCQAKDDRQYGIPFSSVDDLVNEITKDMQTEMSSVLRRKINDYLYNETNQNNHHFSVEKNRIVPLSKTHSFSCAFKLYSQTTHFKVVLALVSISIVISFLIGRMILQNTKASNVYKYLKQKVLEQNTVNVTLLGDEMNSLFGKMNEQLWNKIDNLRKKDAKIGFYEDDFLYWKLL